MLGEIAEQAIHLREIGAVDQIAPLLLDANQARMRQLLQVKGKRVARDSELVRQDARHESWQPGTTSARKVRSRWGWARAPSAEMA